MGLLGKSKLGDILNKGVDILDQKITDTDKLNELKYTLEQARTELLLSGKGSSITKITICGLVSLVVGILSWTYLFHPENLNMAKDYALAVTPIIGLLIGVYGSGSAFKHSKWAKD